MSRRCSATHSAGMNEAAPHTTPRDPAARAANVSVSQPLSRTGTSPSLLHQLGLEDRVPARVLQRRHAHPARSAARSAVNVTPVMLGML